MQATTRLDALSHGRGQGLPHRAARTLQDYEDALTVLTAAGDLVDLHHTHTLPSLVPLGDVGRPAG